MAVGITGLLGALGLPGALDAATTKDGKGRLEREDASTLGRSLVESDRDETIVVELAETRIAAGLTEAERAEVRSYLLDALIAGQLAAGSSVELVDRYLRHLDSVLALEAEQALTDSVVVDVLRAAPPEVRRIALYGTPGSGPLDRAALEKVELATGISHRLESSRQAETPSGIVYRTDVRLPIQLAFYSHPSALVEPDESEAFFRAVREIAPYRRLVVFSDGAVAERLLEIADELELVVMDPLEGPFSPWPRDALRLARTETGRPIVVLRPYRQAGREADSLLGRALVKGLPEELDLLLGRPLWTEAPIPFHNGQILETPGAIWISFLSLESRVLQILGVDAVPVQDFGTAEGIERFLDATRTAAGELKQLFGKDVRFVHPFPEGPLGDMQRQLETIGGGAGYDLDSLITVLARDEHLPGALVASIAVGVELLQQLPVQELDSFSKTYGLGLSGESLREVLLSHVGGNSEVGRLARFLDSAAEHLAEHGVEVARIPLLTIPYELVHRDLAGRLPVPHFLVEWNNVVLEQREGGAYRAEGFSSTLPTGDQLAREQYSEFGHELLLVPPLPASVARNGGYRCSSNQLR